MRQHHLVVATVVSRITSAAVRGLTARFGIVGFLLAAPLVAQHPTNLRSQMRLLGSTEHAREVLVPPVETERGKSPQHEPRRVVPYFDAGLPQPVGGPSDMKTGAAGPLAGPCDPYLFKHSEMTVGTFLDRSLLGEPSVSFRGNTNPTSTQAFATGNKWAALSTDSGASWSSVDPFSKFSSLDGGFCCDQRTMYASETDMTFWYLQYKYSSSTKRGSVRVAYCRGSELDNARFPFSKIFDPQFFGRPSGEWLDFPDVAISRKRIWFTSNIFDAARNYKATVIWSMKLSEVHGTTPVNFLMTTTVDIRLTQGAEDTMYAACHGANTSTLHVYKFADEDMSHADFDVTVPAWTDGDRGKFVSKAPNGTNWLGRYDGYITAGYALPNAGEYGFGWASRPQTNRSHVFCRFARIRESDDKLIAAQDIYNNNYAIAYPATHGNSAGGIGYVVAAGGSNLNPQSYCGIVDECYPSFFNQLFWSFTGTDSSPANEEWGDYFTVQPHPVRTTMFVGTGMGIQTVFLVKDQIPEFAWFGRNHDSKYWIPVSIGSKYIAADKSVHAFEGVPVACTKDKRDRTSITTNGYAVYDASVPITLTAPKSHKIGNDVYEFSYWNNRTKPWGDYAYSTNPSLSISSTGTRDDQCVAVYKKTRQLVITSRGPTSGVPITTSIVDATGNGTGPTPLTRYYWRTVALDAPDYHTATNIWKFERWWVNGKPQSVGNTRFVVREDDTSLGNGTITLEAEYSGIYRVTPWPGASPVDQGWGDHVVAVGDMDRDGYGDYGVSAPFADKSKGADSGVVSFYSGKTQKWFHAVEGPVAGAKIGTSLVGADFDQDGYDDVMLGGAGAYSGWASNIYWVSGRTRALARVWGDSNAIAEHLAVGYFNADKYPDVVANYGTNSIQALGWSTGRIWLVKTAGKIGSLAVLGDRDGDGFSDVLVGIPSYSNNAGRIELRSGRNGSLINSMNGAAGSELGYAVAAIGDVNKNWVPDFAVGAPGSSNGGGLVRLIDGYSFAFLSSRTGTDRFGSALAGVGDFVGDGIPDVMAADAKGVVRVLRGVDATRIYLELPGGPTFGRSLAAIDTNGDSIRDLIIGEPTANSGTLWCYDKATVSGPSRWTRYGATCKGSANTYARILGAPSTQTSPEYLDGAQARLGSAIRIYVRGGARNSVGVLRLGAVRNELPLDGIGMPGCVHLVHNIVAFGRATDRNGAAGFGPLTIPNDTRYIGGDVLWQWVLVDPAANAFGLTMSDAAAMRIGAKR
ncbi:MAG: VCBS repeat-containing protein [Planctomycetes bacterium]|nr:VCBS repeat-containing protein [Planctomycetota bacterium]